MAHIVTVLGVLVLAAVYFIGAEAICFLESGVVVNADGADFNLERYICG